MSFLSQLLSRFGAFIRRSSGRFDQVPERGETLSRFIFSKSHFSATGHRVKPGAFLPVGNPRETSVFRTDGLDPASIRRIGDPLGEQRAQVLKAWGGVLAGGVFDAGLGVRPDNVPERHAAIIGWPDQKDEQLSLAQRLAAAATLQLPP